MWREKEVRLITVLILSTAAKAQDSVGGLETGKKQVALLRNSVCSAGQTRECTAQQATLQEYRPE